ncbi:DUF6492 family protein [Micromonosporaceae bacterium DT55]|uniref:DUF6492 family protein n=1 Tax=Melissospora conviva TaxID=3388432 RepID=UPI003C1CDE42
MTRLAVVTPSYAPDFDLCADLNRSVLAHSGDDVHHHIVVAARDLALFARLAGPRTHIRRASDHLPRGFVPVPRTNLTLNLRRPFPPLRGWITQQIVKLAVTAGFDADAVLLVDSDIEFIRPFGPQTYLRDEVVRFYRKPDAVDESLPRHLSWHRVARELLGLPPARPPFHDYISAPVAWSPTIVRRLQHRIEMVTGQAWADAIGARLHFSEATLYGVFVDEVLGAPATANSSAEMLCHNHYEEVPLDAPALRRFLAEVAPADVAVMISAKSQTPLELRRQALRG